MATNVKDLLPPNLRTQFWFDFADVVEEELRLLKDRIKEKELLYDVANLNDKGELIDIAKSLGYTPDLSLDDSLENVKNNVNSVTFRIRNKTNYISYEYIFKTVPYPGEVFILYYEDNKLQRATIPVLQMMSDLGTSEQPYNEPFTYVAEENYRQFLFSQLFLDMGLRLDSSSRPWALDEFSSSSATNHLAIEYALNRIITQDGEEFLMTPSYLNYLFNAVDYTRKVTEVPHVGSQLSLIMDQTGYYDSASGGVDAYSIPKLKTRCAVTSNYEPQGAASDIYRMVAGTGTQTLPSESDGGGAVWPGNLDNQVVDSVLVDDETDEIQDWKIINTVLPANTVTNEIIGTGDNTVFTKTGTFNVAPIKPYSLKVQFNSSPNEFTIVDDGLGKLFIDGITDYSVGKVNYSTGEYEIATEKFEDVDLEVLSDVAVEDEDLTINLAHPNIESGTFYLYFTIGETGYIKRDNGGGGFSDTTTGITSGSIDYDNGSLEVVFQGETEPREANATEHGNKQGGVTCEYQFTREYEVDDGSEIAASYETTSPLPLTEAGLKDVDGNLIAYATFPPISMDNVRYHASFQFLIYKGEFEGLYS